MRALALLALALVPGCLAAPRLPADEWRTVPANCACEYDEQARIVASFCDVGRGHLAAACENPECLSVIE
jgi:hypothetical protein